MATAAMRKTAIANLDSARAAAAYGASFDAGEGGFDV
eukprot:SAG22_NODE_8315_length_665_cov_0.987633_1_plen_36_part_10